MVLTLEYMGVLGGTVVSILSEGGGPTVSDSFIIDYYKGLVGIFLRNTKHFQ